MPKPAENRGIVASWHTCAIYVLWPRAERKSTEEKKSTSSSSFSLAPDVDHIATPPSPTSMKRPPSAFIRPLPFRTLTRHLLTMTASSHPPPRTYAIAPMMDVTDRHHRALTRLITRHATLYTEMVVDRSLIHNPFLRERELRIPSHPPQNPVVLQLGGSDPAELEAAAVFAAQYPYHEVNLNCGCPSPKVAGKGCFGAALMRTPHVVAEATRRMRDVLPEHIPVTVKCRIGVDDDASYESLSNFVRVVSESGGVRHFIIHARKAILGGLSPAQNRTIPPLRYEFVYKLLDDFPHLIFSINGGVKTVSDVMSHVSRGVHGAMIGRAVMDRPWHALADVDTVLFHAEPDMSLTRRRVLEEYVQYAESEIVETGCSVRAVVRPLINLFVGEKNGKRFRREIDSCLRDGVSITELVRRASAMLSDEVLDALPPSVQPATSDQSDLGRITTTERLEMVDAKGMPPMAGHETVCIHNFESNKMIPRTAVSET